MMNPNVEEVTTDGREKCDFCHLSEIHSLEWGPMYKLEGIVVHYFCLLFSAGLNQNGEDNEGILGFLPEDIRLELRRGQKLKCKFCKESGATIGCSIKACKMSYHFPCGLKAKSSFQFTGNFESYCIKHKEVVEIPLSKSEWVCPICYSPVLEEQFPLWPPCCQKNVFHKECILEMGKNHGSYFFKCPLCNDKDVFAEAMKKGGVYVPDRDATWETVPNAFEEHTRLYSRCDAQPDCLCPEGRDYSHTEDNNPWTVIRCGTCGASGIHKSCGNLRNLTWRCPTCADVLSRKTESLNSSRICRHQYDASADADDENEDEAFTTSSEESTDTEMESNCRPHHGQLNSPMVVSDNQTTDEGSMNEDTSDSSDEDRNAAAAEKQTNIVVDLEKEDDSDLEVVCEKPGPLTATKSSVFLDMYQQSRKTDLATPPVVIRNPSAAPVCMSSAFQRLAAQAKNSTYQLRSKSMKADVVDLDNDDDEVAQASNSKKSGPGGRPKKEKKKRERHNSASDDCVQAPATNATRRSLRKRSKNS